MRLAVVLVKVVRQLTISPIPGSTEAEGVRNPAQQLQAETARRSLARKFTFQLHPYLLELLFGWSTGLEFAY